MSELDKNIQILKDQNDFTNYQYERYIYALMEKKLPKVDSISYALGATTLNNDFNAQYLRIKINKRAAENKLVKNEYRLTESEFTEYRNFRSQRIPKFKAIALTKKIAVKSESLGEQEMRRRVYSKLKSSTTVSNKGQKRLSFGKAQRVEISTPMRD